MKEEKPQTTLPENATRELKPGEEYKPLLQPEKNYPEVTPWSVSIGLVMTIIFSAAAAYLGLKVGQVFEAAIPIAIIAVGLSSALGRKNSLGENVIIFTFISMYMLSFVIRDAELTTILGRISLYLRFR